MRCEEHFVLRQEFRRPEISLRQVDLSVRSNRVCLFSIWFVLPYSLIFFSDKNRAAVALERFEKILHQAIARPGG